MNTRQANKVGINHMFDRSIYRPLTVRRATKVLDRWWRRIGVPVDRPSLLAPRGSAS